LGSVDRLEKITQNYLRLSRLSAGKKASIDLGEILEQVLATYASECQAQGVRIHWSRPESTDLTVYCDPDLMEQALGNLIRNSLQALQEAKVDQPVIVIQLERHLNGSVVLRVEDNGPGVDPEITDRLFAPFVTTKAQGTGLGLSFVKQVLDENGGQIRYVNDKPGACFEMQLKSEGTSLSGGLL
jgi:signal transduction histidine kinase